MAKSFTAGERRGMIVLLLILSIVIAIIYFTNNHNSNKLPSTIDSSATIKQQAIINDTLKFQKQKKSKPKQIKQQKQAPTRDPLSQPVPYETR